MVRFEAVRKEFGAFTAVGGLTLDIPQGEIFGLLGPNGAGKTTTIKMACGLVVPTSGRITIAGVDVQEKTEVAQQHIGYESQQAAVAGAETRAVSDRPGKWVADIHAGRLFDFGSNTTRLILERNEAVRAEVTLVSWPKGSKGAMVSHPEKEQTFFVLSGRGKVTVGDDTLPVSVGDVVFVPWKAPHTTEAGNETLTYLCLNTHVVETKEKSFEEMYNRVAPDRIARWKSRDTAVGE